MFAPVDVGANDDGSPPHPHTVSMVFQNTLQYRFCSRKPCKVMVEKNNLAKAGGGSLRRLQVSLLTSGCGAPQPSFFGPACLPPSGVLRSLAEFPGFGATAVGLQKAGKPPVGLVIFPRRSVVEFFPLFLEKGALSQFPACGPVGREIGF